MVNDFMPDILKLIANKQYWKPFDKREDLVCAYCQKKIDIPSIPDHFSLWTPDKSYFLTLHFKCAFRKTYLSEIVLQSQLALILQFFSQFNL